MRRLQVLLLLLVVACTPARHEVEGDIVRKVTFEGNGGVLAGDSRYLLRAQMEQGDSPFGLVLWPFIYSVDPIALETELLPRDAYRLEVWYAHHGWFDAKVDGFEVRRVRNDGEQRAGVVDVTAVVDPGTPSLVRSIEIVGLDANTKVAGAAVLRSAPIQEGDQFDISLVEQTRDKLVESLQNLAHAYASVEIGVTAHPTEHAVDVVLRAQPGIDCRFGAITVVGTDKVKERFVRDALPMEPGDSYKRELLLEAQRRLFEMGTFGIVVVQPNLSDPSMDEVPVEVSVTETRFRTLRLGAGLTYDGFLPTTRATAAFRHVNLLRQLVRLDTSVRGGAAYDPTVIDEVVLIPTWGVRAALTYPRLVPGRVALELAGQINQDVYSGLWAYRKPEADLSAVWRYSDEVQVRFGPHVEQYAFVGEFGPRQEIAQQQLFGLDRGSDFRYELTSLDLAYSRDTRDDPFKSTRGYLLSGTVRQAVPLSPDGFLFSKVVGEARAYVKPAFGASREAFPFVLAGRLRGQLVAPWRAADEIPLPERAFLGGANSLRGFRQSQVGPYHTLCTYQQVPVRSGFLGLGASEQTESQVSHHHLPTGGPLAAETSLELRYDWLYGVIFAMFVDVGALLPSFDALPNLPEHLRASAGVGTRYHTAVGPVRFDLSFRPLYPEDAGPSDAGLRLDTCLPGDEESRVYDFFSAFPALRGRDHPPFAMVFFLTIGDSI